MSEHSLEREFARIVGEVLDECLRPIEKRLHNIEQALNDMGAERAQSESELLTLQQSADEVKVSVQTIRRWLAKGMRSFGTRGSRRIRRSDLLDFLSVTQKQADGPVDIRRMAERIVNGER